MQIPPMKYYGKKTSTTSSVLLGVSFTDEAKGYVVGTEGTIKITNNAVAVWSNQTSGTGRFLRDVYFSDTSTVQLKAGP